MALRRPRGEIGGGNLPGKDQQTRQGDDQRRARVDGATDQQSGSGRHASYLQACHVDVCSCRPQSVALSATVIPNELRSEGSRDGNTYRAGPRSLGASSFGMTVLVLLEIPDYP